MRKRQLLCYTNQEIVRWRELKGKKKNIEIFILKYFN